MKIETQEQLIGLKKICTIVADCLQATSKQIRPGITTRELDQFAAEYLARHGARSAPMLTYQFPGSVCISVNEQVAHGIPGDLILNEGDLVNVDVSAELHGFFGDTGGSFPVGRVSKKKQKVCRATRTALSAAIQQVRSGQPLNVIGRAIERVAEINKLWIIRDLGSHGVGLSLHEEPKFIPSFYDPEDRRVLEKGMVITIEPFLTTGSPRSHQAKDGWTLLNDEGSATAQYEHTMVVWDYGAEILTHPSSL